MKKSKGRRELYQPTESHAEGDRAYVLVIDEEELVEDIDRENNEAPFALNLWVDDDGDGIPRWWENLNGMSDDNEEDGLPDLDGDGLTSLQEFLAGTDPQDTASRLQLSNVQVLNTTGGELGAFSVSWPSVSGRLYRLERSLDLKQWQTVEENLEPTPPLNTVVDEEVPTGGKVFYRALVQ